MRVKMIRSPWNRPAAGPVRRAVAALLAGVYVALALGAGIHVGDHDESGVEWLPLQFHQHQYELNAADGGERVFAPDACVACHASRLVFRLDAAAPRLPHLPPALDPAAASDGSAPRPFAHSLHAPRGPPTA